MGTRIDELFSIRGKTALITGGARGIGLMMARGFLENGATVYIASRKGEAVRKAEAELGALGPCTGFVADLATAEACQALARDIAAREERLNILIHNSGATWGAPIETFPESGWDKVMDINVKAPFFLTQALLPQLRQAATAEDPARIVMIGSTSGLAAGTWDNYSYGPSKAAVHHLTRVLAGRLVQDNITVNAIAPGPFPTDMLRPMVERLGEVIQKGNPRGRFGTPEDIVGTAMFLCSRAGAYVTGATLPLDGGSVMAR